MAKKASASLFLSPEGIILKSCPKSAWRGDTFWL